MRYRESTCCSFHGVLGFGGAVQRLHRLETQVEEDKRKLKASGGLELLQTAVKFRALNSLGQEVCWFITLQLELELLTADKQNADATHVFYLAARLQALQTFCTHLQNVVKDHKLLAQQLSSPLGGANLPVPAHLRRFVVQVVQMSTDFVETWDEKRSAISRCAGAAANLDQLNTCVSQLLGLASQEEVLADRLLRWKDT
ncbi:HAUS augmin-like complex subunit 2 isoform 2-T2 [Syngnathus typhle]